MRIVVQRVSEAKVNVDGNPVGAIGRGLLVFVGVGPEDDESDIKFIADKIVNLRIFEDEDEKMNLSVKDISGEVLLISQFTLFGDCRKGRRPNFSGSCEPVKAKEIYEKLIDEVALMGIHAEKGIFGADMKVELLNDGPVTILLDSKKLF
ncbi:MAG: D-tyrosyl-tRNA(Tyr) deacylase [Clostridia bacterium]|nr:D-tyrosyl-tRNA(Tyr) deacylase [Clostridia bacterium]